MTDAINDLCFRLENAKALESQAREQRIQAEVALLTALKVQSMEQQTTVKTDYYRVTVKTPLYRKLDPDVELSPDLLKLFVTYKPEINNAALKELEIQNPSAYQMALGGIITTVGKTSVIVTRKDQ